MSKKHFIALADALRPVWESMTPDAQNTILRFCRSQNSQFDWSRFVDYVEGRCGPSGRVIAPTKEK